MAVEKGTLAFILECGHSGTVKGVIQDDMPRGRKHCDGCGEVKRVIRSSWHNW